MKIFYALILLTGFSTSAWALNPYVTCAGSNDLGHTVKLNIFENAQGVFDADVTVTNKQSLVLSQDTYKNLSYSGGMHMYHYTNVDFQLHFDEFAEVIAGYSVDSNSKLKLSSAPSQDLLCCAVNSATYPLERCGL